MSTTCRSAGMRPPTDRPRRGAWYAQPVVWLGIAVFAASIAGCAWLIVVAARYDDAKLPTTHEVFGVPVKTPPANPPP